MIKLPEGERKRRDAEAKKAWQAANPGYRAAWYAANKEKTKKRAKTWASANPEKAAACRAEYEKNNVEKCKEMRANWRRSNKGAVAIYAAKYRASKLGATPAWADLDAIAEFYREAAQSGLHVDHIIPLRGRKVSGLHVPNNLQLLTKSENSRKHNHFEEE